MQPKILGDNGRYDIPEDLSKACTDFLQAGRNFREFLKKNYPDRLHGIVYTEDTDGAMVLYTASPYYANVIKNSLIISPYDGY